MRKYKKYDKIFVESCKDFMLSNGYKNIDVFFEKYTKHLFTRVYLFYEVDRYHNTVKFDIIHEVMPLIFDYTYFFERINEKEGGEFSVSDITGEKFVADMKDMKKVENAINNCISSYDKLYTKFFDMSDISDYGRTYIEYSRMVSLGKISMFEDEEEPWNYQFIFVLFFLGRYDECIRQFDVQIKNQEAYISEFFDNKRNKESEKDYNHLKYLNDFRQALICNDKEFIQKQLDKYQSNIKQNQEQILKHFKKYK